MSETVLGEPAAELLSNGEGDVSSECISYETYHSSRLPADARRTIVWQTLWDAHFRYRVPKDSCVLDIGAGYGEFINNVREAKRRIALDLWPGFVDHLETGIEPIVGDLNRLNDLADGSIDYAFASNLFEHVSKSDFAEALKVLSMKLSDRGMFTVVQPNYAYAFREYFDDYTHISVWSHISLADFFSANGYDVIESAPRFLPLTIKSRLPVSPTLIRAYLKSPIKPMGKQMMFAVKPRR
ncbi:MAG: class I SAM-dependent methyltransferase [Pseudomonadota bacterium]